jgi:hypothetical protein
MLSLNLSYSLLYDACIYGLAHEFDLRPCLFCIQCTWIEVDWVRLITSKSKFFPISSNPCELGSTKQSLIPCSFDPKIIGIERDDRKRLERILTCREFDPYIDQYKTNMT